MSVILTLIIFTVIVVIHEFGHFYVAKKCNVKVEEFAVGMGPKLVGKQFGETLYTIRILPIGGFCRMADDLENDDKIGFNQAGVLQRIAICVAGPVMNFVLALVLMIFISMTVGISTNVVKTVVEGSGADVAQLQAGDRIVEYDGHSIHTKTDLNFYKSETGSRTVSVKVKRDGKIIDTSVTPVYNEESKSYMLGVNLDYKAPLINIIGYDFDTAKRGRITEYISDGYWNSVSLVKLTVLGFERLFTSQVKVDDLSGPIGITAEVDNQYNQAKQINQGAVLITMINFIALLSANLGVINLIPFPAIDGGKILIYLIELITRYRLPKEKEAYITFVGFVLVMGLGVYIAFNDIMKLL